MTRAHALLRAYFAAIVLLVFGALCFDAGLAFGTAMAIHMIRAAAG